MTIGEYRGKKLFAGRLFAGLLFGPLDDQAEDEEGQTALGPHRTWRPAPIAVAVPPKRPRRRRREEILFMAV